MMRTEIKGLAFLLTLAVVTAFVYNHFSPDGIALVGQWDPAKGVTHAMVKSKKMPASIELNHPDGVEQVIKDRSRILIDVRSRDDYRQGHLPTAKSYPLVDFDSFIGQFVETVPMEQPILAYCSSIDCTDSHTFSEMLTNMGYSDVKVFSGGFRAWEESGKKIEK